MNWQLAQAKNRLSEVVNRALSEGPQRITRRGDEVFVVSAADLERMKEPQVDLFEFLRSAPSLEGVDLTRDTAPSRDVDL